MSNPQQALIIQKERLRDAEESDYLLMKSLNKRRQEEGMDSEPAQMETNTLLLKVVNESRDYRNSLGRILRRESAVDGDLVNSNQEISGMAPNY